LSEPARAEIIAIGTELLLGEIVDTNTAEIAVALRAIGLDLFRTTIVGDNVERIAEAVAESLERAQAVITTGGLGPTVDDATREGIALAVGVETEFRPELWEQITERFQRYGRRPTENNRRQAHIPVGAIAIENPVGTAPAFRFELPDSVVISLPGVPAEMSHLLEHEVVPYLRRRLGLTGVIKRMVVRTAGVGESMLDERIEDLERMHNPTLGVSAHPGRVDLRITAKAGSESEADEMIWRTKATLDQRLGDWIYGTDEDTLEAATMSAAAARGRRLAVVESGTSGALAASVASFSEAFAGGTLLAGPVTDDELEASLQRTMGEHSADLGLGLRLELGESKHTFTYILHTPESVARKSRSYGGPIVNAPAWAVSIALEALRRSLKNEKRSAVSNEQ
jgi:nicotinamide-nucleotide amidase